jgi:hypothetical protein
MYIVVLAAGIRAKKLHRAAVCATYMPLRLVFILHTIMPV